MKKSPLVSVIVPIYNVEVYLSECLDSILQQTYKNIEIIAIDDSSTDSSLKLLENYKNEKIFIFKHEHNKGQAAARNLGLKNCTGEIIFFVDADDKLELNTIETVVNQMLKYKVTFARFNAKSFYGQENVFFQESKYNFSKYLKENKVYRSKKLKDIYLSFTASPVLYAFSKEVINYPDVSFKEGLIHEDELFNTELYLKIQNAIYINQSLYIRRYRQNSTMTDKSPEQLLYSFDSYLCIIKQYSKLLNSKSLTMNKKSFLKYRINSILYNLQKYDIDPIYKNEQLKQMSKEITCLFKVSKNFYRFKKTYLFFRNKISSLIYKR